MKSFAPSSIYKSILILFLLALIYGCQDNFDNPLLTEDITRNLKQDLLSNSYQMAPSSFGPLHDLDYVKSQISKYQQETHNLRNSFNSIESNDSRDVVEIYPTGDASIDWLAIQLQLNVSGLAENDLELRLKSTSEDGIPTPFNIGNNQLIIFGERHGHKGKVILTGEKKNGNMTTIKGGIEFERFGFLERRALLSFEREQIKIEGIKFDGGHFLTAGGGGQPIPKEIIIKDSHFINHTGIRAIWTFGTEEKFLLKDCKFDNVRMALQIFNNNPNAIIEDNEIINSWDGFIIGNNASGNYIVRDNSISLVPAVIPIWDSGIAVIITQNTTVDIYENELNIVGPGKIGVFIFEVKVYFLNPVLLLKILE